MEGRVDYWMDEDMDRQTGGWMARQVDEWIMDIIMTDGEKVCLSSEGRFTRHNWVLILKAKGRR